jgi:hypothetical protein
MMEASISSSADIENVQYSTKLKLAYKSCERYATDSRFQWVHVTGETLAGGMRQELEFIANIDDNHQVAVVLDFKNHLILYGDSMGNLPSEKLLDALKWWTHLHTGKNFEVSASQ